MLTLRKMCEVWDEAIKSRGAMEVVSCRSKQIPPMSPVSSVIERLYSQKIKDWTNPEDALSL